MVGMATAAEMAHLARLESLAGYRPRSEFAGVAAAVCYRMRRRQPEFLLVRTRAGRWTFPKGSLQGDANASSAALREAYEEAGVIGVIEAEPFIFYRHVKADARETLVAAFLCEVVELDSPLEDHRDPTWFAAARAAARLRLGRPLPFAAELELVLRRAQSRLALLRQR